MLLVCNTRGRETMRGKCSMLRFKIVGIWIREPCIQIGGYRSFGHGMLRPSSDGL